MAETIKKTFSKTKFLFDNNYNNNNNNNEIDNNLFIFENWKWLGCRESMSCKSDL